MIINIKQSKINNRSRATQSQREDSFSPKLYGFRKQYSAKTRKYEYIGVNKKVWIDDLELLRSDIEKKLNKKNIRDYDLELMGYDTDTYYLALSYLEIAA